MLESPLKKLQVANYFLIALIFFTILLFIRDLISTGVTKQIPPTPPLAKGGMGGFAVTKIKDIMGYAPILEQNPFGKPMKLIPIATEHESEIRSEAEKPVSISELILIGTVVGDKNLSYAIFEDRANPALKHEFFAIGKDVYDYGALKKIEKEWVELTQGTNTYKISLIDLSTKEIHVKSAESPKTTFAKRLGEGQYLLDQRRVQQALNNPEQILTDARLLPNIQDGRQEGFRVSEVRPGGLYESLGIKNGDILLRVNNLEISNPNVAVQAMSALRGMNTVNLDIIRNGSRMTLSYEIR